MKTPLNEIPVFIKHVTMAIYKKNPSIKPPATHLVPIGKGVANETFIASFAMAVAEMVRQRHLSPISEPDGIIMMSSGSMWREDKHKKDDIGQAAAFDSMYRSAFMSQRNDKGSTSNEKEERGEAEVDQARAAELMQIQKTQMNRKAAAELLKGLQKNSDSPGFKVKKNKLSSRQISARKRSLARAIRRLPPKGRV